MGSCDNQLRILVHYLSTNQSNNMNTSSIHEYIERNQARKIIRAKYSNGQMFYFHQGTWITQLQYNKLYPHYEYLRNNNSVNNCDKTKVI